MGLIGGGGAGFIGKVHVTAAQLDRQADLVAGAFSSDSNKAAAAAAEFRVDPRRSYGTYEELLARERLRPPEDDRIDYVSIATPNHTHFQIAERALHAGFDVVCEKPMTLELAEADKLVQLVEKTGAVFVVMHNYTGYPLVRQARAMIAAGELGEIQAVRVQYVQGWLHGLRPGVVPARGAWKADPLKAGAGSLGDIGTHAFQLARYVTGFRPKDLSCRMRTFAPGGKVEDYGHTILELEGGGLAMITFSQVTHGRLNDLSIEIDGTKASLSWRQEEPNQLFVRAFGQPVKTYERHPAAPYMSEAGKAACRLPAGHPEAFYEAFANVYRAAFEDMHARLEGRTIRGRGGVYADVWDGLEGVYFVQRCQQSHRQGGAFVPFDFPEAVVHKS